MRDDRLVVLVPSRGRPQSVPRMVQAFLDTDAYEVAKLVYLIDGDDPERDGYFRSAPVLPADQSPALPLVQFGLFDQWKPMVEKLNEAAAGTADSGDEAIAFFGDDHVPRTRGWAQRFLASLQTPGVLVVYGDDKLQGAKLPTHWAVSSRWVQALGEMVPLDVQHLYCDNAMLELGTATDSIQYLPDVVIEHMHPVAGKAGWDDGYRRVNRNAQYQHDKRVYREWLKGAEIVQQIARIKGIDWG